MMKTIPKREFDQMREVLKDYYTYIRKHTDSLIIRFYGLHGVQWCDTNGKMQVRYLTIMGNIFSDYKVGVRYDLKGSTSGRTCLKPDQLPNSRDDLKIALKDNDFVKHVGSIRFP